MLARLTRDLQFNNKFRYRKGQVVNVILKDRARCKIEGRWMIRPEDWIPHVELAAVNEWAHRLREEDPK